MEAPHADAEQADEGAALFPAGLTLDEVREAVRGIKAYVEFDRRTPQTLSFFFFCVIPPPLLSRL